MDRTAIILDCIALFLTFLLHLFSSILKRKILFSYFISEKTFLFKIWFYSLWLKCFSIDWMNVRGFWEKFDKWENFFFHSNLILIGKSASNKCWSHKIDGSIFVEEDRIFFKLINHFDKIYVKLFGNILNLVNNYILYNLPFTTYHKHWVRKGSEILLHQTEHNYNFRNAINENGFWQTIKTSKTKAVSYLDVQLTSWIIFSVQSYKLEL